MKNRFIKQILTLIQGTAIAQIFPIIISPILTRMYTPEQFGVLAVYMAIISVLTPIVNARYELAISLPKHEKNALALFVLAIRINIVVSSLSAIIIFIFKKNIIEIFSLENGVWLWFLPIGLFLTGLINSFTYINNRMERFDYLAKSKVYQAFSMAFTHLGLGIIKFGSIGLVIGYIVGQCFNLFILNHKLNIQRNITQEKVDSHLIIKMGKEYSEFPKYAMLTHSMESFSAQTPSFFLTKFFGAATAGYYSITNRTINMPLALVGKAVGDVFLSNASKIYRERGDCKEIYTKTFKVLAILPIVPFLILFLWGEDFFRVMFGEEWSIAGAYMKILLPAIYLQFIASPLSHMFIIAQKIKLDLIIQIFIFILSISAFLIGGLYFKSVESSLMLYSIVLSIKYISFIIISYSLSKGIRKNRVDEENDYN